MREKKAQPEESVRATVTSRIVSDCNARLKISLSLSLSYSSSFSFYLPRWIYRPFTRRVQYVTSRAGERKSLSSLSFVLPYFVRRVRPPNTCFCAFLSLAFIWPDSLVSFLPWFFWAPRRVLLPFGRFENLVSLLCARRWKCSST